MKSCCKCVRKPRLLKRVLFFLSLVPNILHVTQCYTHTMTCVYAVPRGGFLFEYFLWTCSGYSAHRRWSRIMKTIENGGAISTVDENAVVTDNLNGFVGWLLFHVSSIGTNGRRQLFYITFLLQYHGLSRNGIDTLSRFGYGLNNTMMDEMTSDCIRHATTKSEYVPCNISTSLCNL
jgi:hypothetical protein